MIRVTVEDTETGESETQEIENDYIVVTAGRWFKHGTNVTGLGTDRLTHVVTLKRDRGEAS